MARSLRSHNTDSGDWYSRLPGVHHWPTVRMAFFAAVGIALVAGTLEGLARLERWVVMIPAASPPLRLEWADLPDWLHLPENSHVLDYVISRSGLTQDDSFSDPTLAQRVGEALGASDIGWVRRVVRVAKVSPDRVIVQCEFRRPVAWIHYAGSDYLVDDEGIRLPGRYTRQSIAGSGLIDVFGIIEKPPEVGCLWQGPDVQAALSVVRLVEDQSFSHQITGIDVENYAARFRRDRPQIALLTDQPPARVWWGRAPGEEDPMENSAEQKIALLNSIYRNTGRVEMSRDYIDVTTWPDRVALPAAADPSTHVPTFRG